MNYSIGIDIGTSSVKVVAFNGRGEVLQSHSQPYSMQHPRPGYSEQDPDEISEAVFDGLAQLLGRMEHQPPGLLSFSAAMHSLILVNANGKCLTPCIIWADNRAGAIARDLRRTAGGMDAYRRSGVPVHAMSPLCKLRWFAENDSKTLAAAAKVIGIKEYLLYQIFGIYVCDTSIASATGLLNLESLQWDPELLKLAGISESVLPGLISPRKVIDLPRLPAFEERFPALSKTQILAGGSDGTLANLGSGCMKQGVMAVTIGTSSAARIALNHPFTDSGQRTFCYHAYDGQYIVGGAGNNGAVVLQWLKEQLLQTDMSFEALFSEAAAVPPGSDGLLFVPLILGERAPVWNSEIRGQIKGLDVHHRRAHLIRACLEGVVFSVFSYARLLISSFQVTEIHVSGGFTQSPFWVQMLADVFNLPVMQVNTEDSSAWGAVMLGLHDDPAAMPQPAILRQYAPDANAHAAYMQSFERFDSELRKLDLETGEHRPS